VRTRLSALRGRVYGELMVVSNCVAIWLPRPLNHAHEHLTQTVSGDYSAPLFLRLNVLFF
jgi:hypothetical protein